MSGIAHHENWVLPSHCSPRSFRAGVNTKELEVLMGTTYTVRQASVTPSSRACFPIWAFALVFSSVQKARGCNRPTAFTDRPAVIGQLRRHRRSTRPCYSRLLWGRTKL